MNIAFVGSEEELHRAMAEAHWFPADPITLKTSVRLVADVLERKPYPDAPVSHLYLWGRVQDLAFEQPVGNSPKQRHHVRFWRSADVDANGEPLWLGAATYDTRVEISRTTGGITHRICPDVDRERDKLIRDTGTAGDLAAGIGSRASPGTRRAQRRRRPLSHRRPPGRGHYHRPAITAMPWGWASARLQTSRCTDHIKTSRPGPGGRLARRSRNIRAF